MGQVKVFVVYAHPGEASFTRHARDAFLRGLEAGGHSYVLSDLYAMGFQADMTEAEYTREAAYHADWPVPADVAAEHEKINACDAIAFVYPVFWTEAPAKLVGWFDRVWTYGFAYGERRMKALRKGLVLCVAGHTLAHLAEYGHLDAMKTVMLGDRLFDRVATKDFVVLDGMAQGNAALRAGNWEKHLRTAYALGEAFGEPVM